MTEIYNMTAKLFIGGEEFCHNTIRELHDVPPKNETIDINWDNILDTFRDYDFLINSFRFTTTKRGRKLELYGGTVLKEWLSPRLNDCKIMITYSKQNGGLTLKELLETDCDKAIQYIKERLH